MSLGDDRSILAAYRARVAARLEALGAITPEQWQAEGFTPRGQDTYGRFMRLRVMDLWMHEQDIREAVDRPGHDTGLVIDLALDEFQQTIGDVIEKQSRTSGNTSVTIALTGPPAATSMCSCRISKARSSTPSRDRPRRP